MKKFTYPDGSFYYTYCNGDYVQLINPRKRGFISNNIGEWGRVYLEDREDRIHSCTGLISFITINTAGVSTDKDSFQQRITCVPVWDVAPISKELQDAIIQAEELPTVKGMLKCVYHINGVYSVNYKPDSIKIGDTIHYDHGCGIQRNNDATIVFICI